jgi:hypothetical protein
VSCPILLQHQTQDKTAAIATTIAAGTTTQVSTIILLFKCDTKISENKFFK